MENGGQCAAVHASLLRWATELGGSAIGIPQLLYGLTTLGRTARAGAPGSGALQLGRAGGGGHHRQDGALGQDLRHCCSAMIERARSGQVDWNAGGGRSVRLYERRMRCVWLRCEWGH